MSARRSRFLAATTLAAAFLSGASAPARAEILGPFVTTAPIPASRTDYTGVLRFPKFDPSLGPLVSLTLTSTSTLDGDLVVTNNGAGSSSGNVRTEVFVTLSWTGGSLVNDILTPSVPYALSSGQAVFLPSSSPSQTVSATFTDGATLTEFTGAGEVSLSATTFTQTILTNTGGNTDSSQSTFAGATGTVTYTYLVVPEPGSFLLLALGLMVGFGLRNRGAGDFPCHGDSPK